MCIIYYVLRTIFKLHLLKGVRSGAVCSEEARNGSSTCITVLLPRIQRTISILSAKPINLMPHKNTLGRHLGGIMQGAIGRAIRASLVAGVFVIFYVKRIRALLLDTLLRPRRVNTWNYNSACLEPASSQRMTVSVNTRASNITLQRNTNYIMWTASYSTPSWHIHAGVVRSFLCYWYHLIFMTQSENLPILSSKMGLCDWQWSSEKQKEILLMRTNVTDTENI